MILVPARPLTVIFSLLLLIQSARAEWPKVLVLPPESPQTVDTGIRTEFQWHLADVLHDCRFFEVVMQQEYELYCRAQGLDPADSVPDSALPDMMAALGAPLVARASISQLGGNLAAEVSYTIPADYLTCEDYVISSGRQWEENAGRSWNLAGDCIDSLVAVRTKVYRVLDAREAYGEVLNNHRLKLNQLVAFEKQALESCRRLVKLEPRNRMFRYMEAVTLMDIYKRRRAEAVGRFQAILAGIDPDHVPTHERLAAYYFDNGELESALRHYTKLTELEPDSYSHTSRLGQVLARMGRNGEAAAIYERLIAISDTDSEIRHWLAEYYEEQADKQKQSGNREAADSLLARALAYMTRSCELSHAVGGAGDSSWMGLYCQRLNYLAMLQREQSGAGSEVETLRKIVELEPDFPGAMYNLGVYEHLAGNFEQALEYYIGAIGSAERGQRAELSYQIGVINLRQFGRYPEAIAALSAALDSDDIATGELAVYLRGTAYYAVAERLNNGGQSVALDDSTSAALQGFSRTEQAGWYYDRALDDFRRVSPENAMLAESVRQHIESIEIRRKKLAGAR